MKKQVLAITAIAGLALGAAIAQGSDSTGKGIVGSVHDLSGNTGTTGATFGVSDPGKRICAFCHSPHHSQNTNQEPSADVANLGGTGVTAKYKIYAPLWSRTDLNKINAGQYGTYQSQTFNPDSENKPYDPLIGPSRLCLTCHDGSIALDAYYGNTAATAVFSGDDFNGPMGGGKNSIGIASGSAMLGGGLTNDHPIGMRYSDFQGKTRADGSAYELMADSTNFRKTDGTASTVTVKSVLYNDPTDLANTHDFVTCASCHDVHNGKAVGNNAPSGGMNGFLLYGSQVSSSFCLTCHDKNAGVVPAGN